MVQDHSEEFTTASDVEIVEFYWKVVGSRELAEGRYHKIYLIVS
jgi:hypothetical protein